MAEEDKTPAIRVSIASSLGDKSQISFETYFDHKTPVEAINVIVDRMMAVRDRQATLAGIEDLKQLIKREEKALVLMGDQLIQVDAMHKEEAQGHTGRASYKLNPKQMADRRNVVAGIDNRKRLIENLKEELKAKQEAVGA